MGGPGEEVLMGTAAQEFNARFERVGSDEAIAERAAERADYEARYEAMMARKRAAREGFCAADVGAARTMQSYENADGITLTINAVSYGKVDVESVLDGEAAAIECTATADGRHYDRRGWCECGGASSDDAGVFVERWSGAGREFHGWICRECRKLVQAG